ncbi:hypothetical protein KAU45_02590 [bacterium]|nr:hypothetical protein [bacterium]
MSLSANRYDERFAAGWQLPFPVAASTTIYKGALVCVNSSGYLVPADDASGLRFVGVARDGADNSSGSDGDVEIVVVTQGSIVIKKSNAAAGDVGESAYCSDDETVALSTINEVYAGLIVSVVDTGNVRFRFDAGDCAPS